MERHRNRTRAPGEGGQSGRQPPVGMDDVGARLLATRRTAAASDAGEAGRERRHAEIASVREQTAAVGEAFEAIGRIARPHDLDAVEPLTRRKAGVVGSDDGHGHTVARLATREVEEERGDGIVEVSRERRGHVEDPIRHRPVPYGPVMSRADGAVVPRWFELGVLSAAAFIAGFGLAGLALAVVGAFHVVLVIAVGVNAGLLCVLGVLRLPDPEPRASAGRGAIAAVIVTVVVVAGMTVMNGWAHGQHLLSTRDPGIYMITGKWLSEQSQLPVDAAVGPFAGF